MRPATPSWPPAGIRPGGQHSCDAAIIIASAMLKTHGLTHISLAVRDLDRTLRFYTQVFGVREYFRDETSIQVQGPGPHDIIAFEQNPDDAGAAGGIAHFGFRLMTPADIDLAIA